MKPSMRGRSRGQLLRLLAEVNDEAFAYVALGLIGPPYSKIWPDNLGDFSDRNTVLAIQKEASRYCGVKR